MGFFWDEARQQLPGWGLRKRESGGWRRPETWDRDRGWEGEVVAVRVA